MSKTITYQNDFDGNESLSGSLTVTLRPGSGPSNGTSTQIRDATYDNDADQELVLYDGTQVGGFVEFADETFDSAGGEPSPYAATSFTMTATVDMIDIGAGTTGNLEIDGFSFNFGATSTLPGPGDGVTTPAQGALEQGVSEGLSIRVVPISETLQIVWNGEVLASAYSNQLVYHGVSTMTVSVDESGLVTVHLADVDLAAQIPPVGGQSGFEAADQTDWGFSFAGRTGGNTGEVWIDDISLTAQVVCFASGTLIETARGAVPVEHLERGDLVLTRDHGARPVRWIASRHLTSGELAQRPRLAPIRIAAGALGAGLPAADLLVSPQHRLLARSAIVRRMFDTAEVLVAAKHLTDLPGVGAVWPAGGVTYRLLLFDAHEIVLANGIEAESLFIGPQARLSLGLQGLKEILSLFPELASPGFALVPARPLIGGRGARQMVKRHVKNKLCLTAPPQEGAPCKQSRRRMSGTSSSAISPQLPFTRSASVTMSIS